MIDLNSIRADGAAAAADYAMRQLQTRGNGFWIHLDVDVIDDAVMPAVDYRLPGGLSWEEVVEILRMSMASGGPVGINITIFNPTLDGDGSIANALVATLVAGLRL